MLSSEERKEAPKIFHRLFTSSLKEITQRYNAETEIGILFSGGVDSLSIILGLLDIGKKPGMLYTIHLEEYQSEDARAAIRIARSMGINHRVVTLKEDYEGHLAELIKRGMRFEPYIKTKAKVETIIPFLYLFEKMKNEPLFAEQLLNIKCLLIGFGADDLNGGSSRKSALHFRNEFDYRPFFEYRVSHFKETVEKELPAYNNLIKQFYRLDAQIIDPYYSSALQSFMLNTFKTWKELHVPRQKWMLHDAFITYFGNYPELWRQQSGMQSESKFREWFKKTLKTESVIKTYNKFYQECQCQK